MPFLRTQYCADLIVCTRCLHSCGARYCQVIPGLMKQQQVLGSYIFQRSAQPLHNNCSKHGTYGSAAAGCAPNCETSVVKLLSFLFTACRLTPHDSKELVEHHICRSVLACCYGSLGDPMLVGAKRRTQAKPLLLYCLYRLASNSLPIVDARLACARRHYRATGCHCASSREVRPVRAGVSTDKPLNSEEIVAPHICRASASLTAADFSCNACNKRPTRCNQS